MVYYLTPNNYGLEVSMKSAQTDYRVVGVPALFFLLTVALIYASKPSFCCDTVANKPEVNKVKTFMAGLVAAAVGVAVVKYGIKEEAVSA